MDQVEREYEYKPKWWAILLSMGHFVLGAVACAYLSSRPGPDSVRVVYGVLGGLCIGFAALAGVRAVERLFLRRRIALTPAGLLLPKSLWSAEEVAIDYGAITGLFLSAGVYAPWASRVAINYRATSGLPTGKVRRARFLYLTHPGGNRRIDAAELPSQAEFEELCELITARVHGSQAGSFAPREPPVRGVSHQGGVRVRSVRRAERTGG